MIWYYYQRVSAAGYLVAFTAREDRGGALGNYGEVTHAVFVHGSGALALAVARGETGQETEEDDGRRGEDERRGTELPAELF